MDHTRDTWITAFVGHARKAFADVNLTVPEVRIGTAVLGRKTLGVCWPAEASSVGAAEITVCLKTDETRSVAGTITHELVHACGFKGHRRDFTEAGRSVGLSGKPTQMAFMDSVPAWAEVAIAEIGDYPKGKVEQGGGVPRQGTRMIKCSCSGCDIVFRTTRTHIENKDLGCPNMDCDGELIFG